MEFKDEKSLEPPTKRRKISIEAPIDDTLVEFNEVGVENRSSRLSIEENFKKMLKEYSRQLELGVFLNEVTEEQEEEEEVEEETVKETLTLLTDSLVEMEKLKTFTREFPTNYRFCDNRTISVASTKEILQVKRKAVEGIQKILFHGRKQILRRQNRAIRISRIIKQLQTRWNVKKTDNTRRAELYIDLSVSAKEVPVYIMIRNDNPDPTNEDDFEMEKIDGNVDLILSKQVTYGKRPMRVSAICQYYDIDVEKVLEMSQLSAFDRLVFNIFVQSVAKSGFESKAWNVVKYTDFEIGLAFSPQDFLFVEVKRMENPVNFLWELECHQSILKDEKFDRMVKIYMRMLMLKTVKRMERGRTSRVRVNKASFEDDFVTFLNELAELCRRKKEVTEMVLNAKLPQRHFWRFFDWKSIVSSASIV